VPYIELAGDRLWARSQGVGEDVLLIAGLADDSSSWEARTEGLSQRFRVTVFDNRGIGRSSTPPGSRWSVGNFARDEGCGHQPFQEQPVRFNDLAAGFLAAAGARSQAVSR
jgi:pimeloyl-ACP methyl ester carboxylesterase